MILFFGTQQKYISKRIYLAFLVKKAIEALSNFFLNTLEFKSYISKLGIDNTHFATMAKNAYHIEVLQAFKKDIEATYTMCLQ